MKHYPLKDVKADTLQRVAQGVLNTYHLGDLQEIDLDKALRNEIKDLWALNEGNDPQSLNEVRKRRQLSDSVTDEALMPQIFERDNGQVFLAHVCRNEADETLIEIFSNLSLDLATLKEITPQVCQAFSWCQAKYITVWTRPGSDIEQQLLALPGTLPCDSFVAAEPNQLLTDIDTGIRLRPFDLEQDWPWYQQEYNEFLAKQPEMKTIVPISEKEEIKEAIENNLCACAMSGDKPIGMIMGESSSELGYNGLLFNDIFIAGQYRGLGYASPMQRLFIKEQINKFEFFFGFINRENTPSIKNAFKQGRRLLRQEICIPGPLLI
ncbi:hypothetical protein [Thalassomonas actiniarum]|uniref:N-acetyltransferase domain-containing protein n=1 Tax=Thalassomonas actiniarum TaxID=485447 RepID=A0AAF0C3U9_9GAMM|nr:hypothetical protein [Thalassomonas actiniarum]WDD99340.1 hypothetical protein SG35_001215 [Thalassomonas actiniarum]